MNPGTLSDGNQTYGIVKSLNLARSELLRILHDFNIIRGDVIKNTRQRRLTCAVQDAIIR